MNYDRYLELQTRLEWFYDFHPEFFNDISPAVNALYKAAGAGSLFDYDK